MSTGYQARDHEIVDYKLVQLEGVSRPVRGPLPADLARRKYFSCVGAAQTFGCFAQDPFPNQLSTHLKFPALNLGIAGAGPSFFLRRPEYMRWINGSAFVILQIMSARSVSNRVLQTGGGELLKSALSGVVEGAIPAYRKLLHSMKREELCELIQETQHRWVEEMSLLIREISVPVILFWFSKRGQDYELGFDSVHSLFGAFPQFVQGWMVDLVRNKADSFVSVVSDLGLPQPLISRFTGEPVSVGRRQDLGKENRAMNNYYPSPQMHELATRALLPVCKTLCSRLD